MRRASTPSVTTTPWAMDILPSQAPAAVPANVEAAQAVVVAAAEPTPTETTTPTYAPPAEYAEAVSYGLPVATSPTSQPYGTVPPPLSAPPGQPYGDPPPTGPQPTFPPPFVMTPSPETKKGLPKRTKAAIGIGGGVVVLAVLAVVVIPMFSSHKPPAVTLVLPATLQDSTPLKTPAAQQAASKLQSSIDGNISFASPQSAIYGHDGVATFGIVTAKLTHLPSASDMAQFMDGVQGGSGSVPLLSMPPGPLGGLMKCGIETTDGTQVAMCASIDKSAVVVTDFYNGDLTDDAALAQKLRLTVEQH